MNLSEGNGGAATGRSHLWKPLTKYRTITFKKKKASQSVSVLSLAARFLSTTHFKHETTVFQMLARTLLHVDFSPEI